MYGFYIIFLYGFYVFITFDLNGRNGSEGRKKGLSSLYGVPPKRASKALHVLKADVTSLRRLYPKEISKTIQTGRRLGETWSKMLMVCLSGTLLLHFVNMENTENARKTMKRNTKTLFNRHAYPCIVYYIIPQHTQQIACITSIKPPQNTTACFVITKAPHGSHHITSFQRFRVVPFGLTKGEH